jgi:predicted transcriptional regulator
MSRNFAKSPFLQSIWYCLPAGLAGCTLFTAIKIKFAAFNDSGTRRSSILATEQRRTKYDIYADIIEIVARKGICSLTRVSYGANMPVDRTKKELSFLVAHGFINEIMVEDAKKYRATKWGLEYLETFKRMRKFFAALEQ